MIQYLIIYKFIKSILFLKKYQKLKHHDHIKRENRARLLGSKYRIYVGIYLLASCS